MMFASYCAMLLLPTLALALTYGSSSVIIKEEIQTYNQYLLDECMRSSEEVFDLADHMMNSMAFSRTTQEFLMPDTYNGSSLLTRVKKYPKTYPHMRKSTPLPEYWTCWSMRETAIVWFPVRLPIPS